jgi:membrane protein implicated in regulation of membrane protease activity
LLLVLAVLAAILLVPAPWNVVLVVGAAVVEGLEVWFFRWWTRRRRPVVGADALVGQTAVATTALAPVGHVRVVGELWRARSEQPVEPGGRVVIRAVEPDLTLMVEAERD